MVGVALYMQRVWWAWLSVRNCYVTCVCVCRTLRLLTVLLRSARLRMLMAWCSTLGGAHSQLGESLPDHVRGEEKEEENVSSRGSFGDGGGSTRALTCM